MKNSCLDGKSKRAMSILCDFLEYDREHLEAIYRDANRMYQSLPEQTLEADPSRASLIIHGKNSNNEAMFFELRCIHRDSGAFYRFFTKEKGLIECQLPHGKWDIIVSAGNYYYKEYMHIDLGPSQNRIEKSFLLQPITTPGTCGFAGDLHHHSVFSSPKYDGTDDVVESPREVRLSMQSAGLVYGALSDHHNILNHEEWEAEASEEFLPILSKEISTSRGHVLGLGAREDVIFQIPDQEQEDSYYLDEFRRIAKAIRVNGGIAQLNHPCEYQRGIRWKEAWDGQVKIFDTVEVWNGATPMFPNSGSNNQSFHRWIGFLRDGNWICATASSDCHNTSADDFNKVFRILHALEGILSEQENPIRIEERPFWTSLMKNDSYKTVLQWLYQTYGSGSARTMLWKRPRTTIEALDDLRAGRSYLASQALAKITENESSITITLLAEQAFCRIFIYDQTANNDILDSFDLEIVRENDKTLYRYEKTFEKVGGSWFVLRADGPLGQTIISNPITL